MSAGAASGSHAAAGRVIVITGAMAAGKSTVAQLLAERWPRSVHLRGDAFRRMIVNGRADMAGEADQSGEAGDEAVRQLRLRHRLAASAATAYALQGFDVVVQDVIIGTELVEFLAQLEVPRRHLIVLAPTVSSLEDRERQRSKIGYTGFSAGELDRVVRAETPKIGYWLDSSQQTPSDTVAEILDHLEDAQV